MLWFSVNVFRVLSMENHSQVGGLPHQAVMELEWMFGTRSLIAGNWKDRYGNEWQR